MSKNFAYVTIVVFGLISSQAFAATIKHPAEPTGAARAAQFAKVLKWCQDKYGGGQTVYVEWQSLYGKSGWWCRHH